MCIWSPNSASGSAFSIYGHIWSFLDPRTTPVHNTDAVDAFLTSKRVETRFTESNQKLFCPQFPFLTGERMWHSTREGPGTRWKCDYYILASLWNHNHWKRVFHKDLVMSPIAVSVAKRVYNSSEVFGCDLRNQNFDCRISQLIFCHGLVLFFARDSVKTDYTQRKQIITESLENSVRNRFTFVQKNVLVSL